MVKWPYNISEPVLSLTETCPFRSSEAGHIFPNRTIKTGHSDSGAFCSHFGTGRNRTRNRTEPDRATTRPKNEGRTASNQTNRTKPIDIRKIRNRNESNRTGSFLECSIEADPRSIQGDAKPATVEVEEMTLASRQFVIHPVPITRFSLTRFVPRVGSEKFESW